MISTLKQMSGRLHMWNQKCKSGSELYVAPLAKVHYNFKQLCNFITNAYYFAPPNP